MTTKDEAVLRKFAAYGGFTVQILNGGFRLSGLDRQYLMVFAKLIRDDQWSTDETITIGRIFATYTMDSQSLIRERNSRDFQWISYFMEDI